MMNALIILLILIPLVFGSIGYFVSKKLPKAREYIAISINSIEMALMVVLATLFVLSGEDSIQISGLLGMGLSFKADAFRVIYATISIFLWLMTITFSRDYMSHQINKDRYYFFYLLTLTGVVGVFFSDDLFTLYSFFEIMSIASYPLVIHDEKEESMKAGVTYIAIAIVTGMILLMGIFIIYSETRILDYDSLRIYFASNGVSAKIMVAGILMLVGFGAKAGMFPLHIWLPKAHPVAPAPASALLSGILTKSGIFGVIVISANIFFANYTFGLIMLVFAVITMLLGAILALFSVDLKRTLACSSMSQIGFILTGLSFMLLLGNEGSIAAQGAMLHMINHSFIKLVLFMCAGVVAMNAHSLNLNDIKGFGRKKIFLMVIFLIGALGIMGIPFFNGYASKTMIHEAITEYISVEALSGAKKAGFVLVEWLFLISGGITIAYMTKLFICIFVEKNEDEDKQKEYDKKCRYMSPISQCVFVLSAIMIPVIGILPNIVGTKLTGACNEFFNVEKLSSEVIFFNWESLKGAIISLAIGVVVYCTIVRYLFISRDGKYLDLWPKWLDLEYLVYRPVLVQGTMLLCLYVFKGIAYVFDGIIWLINKTILRPDVYEFEDFSIQHRIGLLIDKISPKKNDEDYHARKADRVSRNIRWNFAIVNFSFAMAMACLGMTIIILFALLA